jgi:hypothetical protein
MVRTIAHRIFIILVLPVILTGLPAFAFSSPEKEFLTEKEIIAIRENQEIARRIKIYMEAAALRLKSAEERLTGKESAKGDPFEFFTPEDMLEGYYRILRSVIFNLDEVYQSPRRNDGIAAALKALKEGTEKAVDQLKILKKIAEDQKKERLWNLVNQAIDITNGAHEGAEYGLSKQSSLKK